MLSSVSQETIPDVISYIRFEEGSGFGAFDQTGLLDGELLGFPDLSPGAGDTGGGWSTIVPSATVPLTGAPNTGSLHIGGTAYVDLSNGNDLSLGTAFTIEFYMKPEPVVVGSVAFAFSDSVSGVGLTLAQDAGNLYYWYGFSNGSENPVFYEPATNVVVGQWQHVAIVKEPGQSAIYLNGVMVVQNTFSANSDPYTIVGIDEVGYRTIGNEAGGTWRGWIDEFRISDTALTPDQFLGAFPIPEPTTFLLTLFGLFVFGLRRRKESRL
jgi:hypothetical protein